MKSDIKTNFDIADALTAAAVTDATANSASVNGADYASAAFFVAATAVGTSLDVALEFSDDDTTFVAATDGRNDIAADQLTDAGTARLDVVVWEKQYARVAGTAVGAVTFGVTSVAGPKYSVPA